MMDAYGIFQDIVGKTIGEVEELRSTNGETPSIILRFTDGSEVQIGAYSNTSLRREETEEA